jgi:EAL domain-containing protein (putative c-di-GMP-specific phosphodiesterase class I)
MAHSSVDQAMVESMNQVAHALGKQTIAECVENEDTLQILGQMGVDRAQGNFIGRPNEALLDITRAAQATDLTLQTH